MLTHKVIWGTLWVLAELISVGTSTGSRDPSPSSSQRSGGGDLESRWVEGVEGAVRNADSLRPLLGSSDVSGPNAPAWIDLRVDAFDIMRLAPGKNPNELLPAAKENDVSEDELKLMKKNAERAFLAYCPESIIKKLETSCEVVTNENLGMKDEQKRTRKEFFIIPENSVKIMQAHYPRIWARSAFGVTGIGALVLVDERAREIVVSVRGTIGLMNWITDAAVIVVSARHMCKGCYMHSGFWIATREIHRTVKAKIEELWALPKYKDFALTVTGHSLGGAVAYLLRLQFAVDKDFCKGAIDLVTFGQPKAGNRELAMWAEKLPGNYLRVTHSDDLVVSMPASFGWTSFRTGHHYVHTRNEYHIKPFPDPSCQNIPVDDWKTTHVKKMSSEEWFYNGGTHRVGRYGLPIPTTFSPISSHSLYLYRTNICSTKPPKLTDPPTKPLKDAKAPSLDELLVELGIDAVTHPHGKGIIGNGYDEWESIRPSINAAVNPQGQGRMSDVD